MNCAAMLVKLMFQRFPRGANLPKPLSFCGFWWFLVILGVGRWHRPVPFLPRRKTACEQKNSDFVEAKLHPSFLVYFVLCILSIMLCLCLICYDNASLICVECFASRNAFTLRPLAERVQHGGSKRFAHAAAPFSFPREAWGIVFEAYSCIDI